MVILGSPKTDGHSPKARLCGDDGGGSLVEPAHEVEEVLAAGLYEGQVAEFVEDNEVAAGELLCDTPLATGAELGSRWLTRSTTL